MEFYENIRNGNTEEIKKQLEGDPALIEKKDAKGFSPLVLATYNGQYPVAKLLLDQGASVDARDAAGNTALMGVCFKGSTELAELLIAQVKSRGTPPIGLFNFSYLRPAEVFWRMRA